MISLRSWALVGTTVLFGAACAADPDIDPRRTPDTTLPAEDEEATSAEPPAPTQDAPSAAQVTTPTPTPTPSDYEIEKAWAEAHGVTIEPGITTVVGKRRGADQRTTTYDDTLVVLRPDATVVRFVGTTKPAQMPVAGTSLIPDVDGDGRKDLGIVRPGIYRALGDVTFGVPGYERTAYKIVTEQTGSGNLPAWRDLSGDGVYSPSEKTLSEQRNYTISGIYIHYGFEPTGTTLGGKKRSGPWSVGCQNVLYSQLDDFVAAVGGATATFRYAVVVDDTP